MAETTVAVLMLGGENLASFTPSATKYSPPAGAGVMSGDRAGPLAEVDRAPSESLIECVKGRKLIRPERSLGEESNQACLRRAVIVSPLRNPGCPESLVRGDGQATRRRLQPTPTSLAKQPPGKAHSASQILKPEEGHLHPLCSLQAVDPFVGNWKKWNDQRFESISVCQPVPPSGLYEGDACTLLWSPPPKQVNVSGLG